MIEPPREITVELVRRRAARQRQSIAGMSIGTAAAIVAAIAVPIAIAGHSHGPSTAVEAGLPGLVLGSLASGRIVVEDFDSKQQTFVGTVENDEPILSTNPASGWVIATEDASRGGGRPITRLETIDASGHASVFGPAYSLRSVRITDAAVSPDGSMIAIAEKPEAIRDDVPDIRVLPMPGHSGSRRTWQTGNIQDVVENLSWSSNGRQLAYELFGHDTNAGYHGDHPITIDLSRPSGTAPTVHPWRDADPNCFDDAASWLGGSGQFAVIEECGPHDRGRLAIVDPTTGRHSAPTTALPGDTGCGGAAMHPNQAGDEVLVSWCGRVYLVSGQEVRRLPGGLMEAAFPGTAPTS